MPSLRNGNVSSHEERRHYTDRRVLMFGWYWFWKSSNAYLKCTVHTGDRRLHQGVPVSGPAASALHLQPARSVPPAVALHLQWAQDLLHGQRGRVPSTAEVRLTRGSLVSCSSCCYEGLKTPINSFLVNCEFSYHKLLSSHWDSTTTKKVFYKFHKFSFTI